MVTDPIEHKRETVETISQRYEGRELAKLNDKTGRLFENMCLGRLFDTMFYNRR